MIRMIAAVSQNAIIGLEGSLPWKNSYPEDLKFFREKTKGSTVIMGRATFESMGRALPKRRNIVISKIGKGLGLLDSVEGIEVFNKLDEAVQTCKEGAWLIGGSHIYEEGMKYADEIYLTLIPEYIDVNYKKHAKFPWVNPQMFQCNEEYYAQLNNELNVVRYTKVK